MTLRARLTALTTVLLGGVLAGGGVALERLDAKDVERSLDERARERAASPAAVPAWGSPAGGLPGNRTLVAEPDGARIEMFQVEQPPPDRRGDARVRVHAAAGKAGLDASLALARSGLGAARPGERVDADGATWAVAVEAGTEPIDGRPPAPTAPQAPSTGTADGQEPRPPPPPPGAMESGDGLPPPPPPFGRREAADPPPPPPPRLVTVAFLEVGPARERHRAFTLRMVGIGVAALLLGAFLAWALSGRMLKPVRDAAIAAEGIERLDQRLPDSGSRDELSRLVAVVNGMLGRLEAASERERIFLATASHELRRPLTALLGELELAIREGRDAQSLRASVSLAAEDAQAMKRLVEDLLHHARAKAGTLRLVEADIDLVELVVEAVERSRRTVSGSMRVKVGDLPALTLRGDADSLRQVLENLLVNAGVHGGEGVEVAVGAEVVGGEVRIHVDDDGEGISSDDLSRLFEPFSRGDRTRSIPGFGLGLTIARDLAEAHGGRVTVASPLRPGDPKHPGTRFTIHLPASRVVRSA